MKNHLNIFEYYSQIGVLPIENNSTRNLGIVIKNNPIILYGFLDLIRKESKINIQNPGNPDDWFIRLQLKIKNFAKEDIVIQNVVGVTLTTKNLEFFGLEDNKSNVENITDMVVYSNGTLIIIEAKRNNIDARKQLKRQISELEIEWKKSGSDDFENVKYISLTWDNIVESLNNINNLIEGRDAILNDYIEHIKNSVPKFFPVQTFDKLNEYDYEHIKRRIERFAENYNTEFKTRNTAVNIIYWVKLFEKEYIKELAYQNYSKDLKLYLFPGNTIGQGYSLFREENKLSILNTKTICVNNYNLEVTVRPNLKISDSWGRWKFDINVGTLEQNILKEIFKNLCGKRKSSNNSDLFKDLDKYNGIISTKLFEEHFKDAFKKNNHDYTFILSLTFGIIIENMFDALKTIDKTNPISPESDSIANFTKSIVNEIYSLIEK